MRTPQSEKLMTRIAFIQASWHKHIVDQGRVGFLHRLNELGISSEQVEVFEVPGALEIPLKCQQVCNAGEHGLIVAAGFVVDGGIYRHEFVAQSVMAGMMDVQLKCEVPILSMVLTPINFHDNEEHNKFFFEHFVIKGQEAAETAVSLLSA